MNTLSTFASMAADLTAGWKPQGEADEVDLAEARVALERTLQAGKTAAVVPGPVEQQSLAHDLQAARPLALLRPLPEAQGLARTVPPWAHGMATSASLGPFVDAVGVPHWVDLITVRKTFSVVRGPAATPLCVLQLELPVFAPVVAPVAGASSPSAAPVAPALQAVHATFGPGSLWFVVRAFDATAPADAFGGLAFQSGRVTISGAYSLSGGVITLSPTATLLIELVPLPAPAPGAGTGGGADFRNAVLTLPAAVSFRFAAAGNSLSAMTNALLTAYGSTQQFSHQAASATYNAALALLAFPCVVQPAGFGVSSSASPIFRLAGSATVLGGAYALPVAITTPGSLGAAAAGGYLSLVTAGPLSVALAGASAPAPLAGAVLLSTPSTLLVFVQTVTAGEQRYELWDGRQARPSSLQARVAAGATVVFVSSAHSEFTLEDAAIDALLDRPVAANGDTLTVSFASALVAVLFTHSPATLLVFAAQAPTNALWPLVLDNAWLRVGQATVFELYGRLQGSRVIRGALSLAMPLVDLLPTLPDPYLARYIGQREGGIAGIGAGGADAVATVQWATPATPRLLFTMLPLPAAAGASGSARPVLGDALAGTPRSSVQGLAELLDVSTNADLLGVFIYESAAALGFEGISLVAQLDQLLLFAVPQISWEPLLTPGGNWGFVSPDDGTAAFMFVQSAQSVRIAPGLLFDLDVQQAGAARTVGAFTLPFGIDATLDTAISGGPNPPLPSFGAMQPQFPGQQGARQLAISAGNLPASDAALTGSANATPAYGLSVLGGGVDGAGTFFNQQFDNGGVEPRIPVWRYDLCGYGASLFSNWTPAGTDPDVGISNAHFDVSVGRTIYEVVQAKSYIYPWAIPVVETVTMQRQTDGSVTRIATGWRAYKAGTFDFGLDKSSKANVPAAQLQRGPFAGLFNVHNIRSTGQTVEVPNGADPAHPFRYERVYFDADLKLTDTSVDPSGVKLVTGQDGNGRFQSRGVLGWLQVSVGSRSTILELEQLMFKTGPASGPIAGMIDIGSNGTLMALSQVDADISLLAAAGPSIVAALRGAPQLPRDGSWGVSKRSGGLPPAALGAQSPVPLVRPNGTTAWQMAEPSEVGAPAQTFYGLLQSTGTQKSLYESPLVAPGGSGYSFPQVPKLADVGSLLGLANLFPDLGSALQPPSFGGLAVSGDGLRTTIEWDIGGQPGDPALIHPGRKLLDFGPVQVYLEFTTDPTLQPPPAVGSHVTLVLDPTAGASANGRWSFSIRGINAYVLVAGASSAFDPLLWISGDCFVSEKSAPNFANLSVKFGSAMSVVNGILTALADIAASLPGGSGNALSVKFAGSTLSITEGFTLPTLPLGFGQISNVGMNLGSAIDLLKKQLNFQVGIGSPQAPVTWSFFPLAGNGCVVVAANQNGLGVIIQAGLGLGLTINVAVASGSASIIFAVQVNTTGSTFDIKAMLTGNAQVDVLGGLASASLTLSAGLDIQPLGGGDFDLTAQVAVAIHISICWVISVDFDGSWSMSEQLSA